MASQGFVWVPVYSNADGSAVTGTTAASLLPAQSKLILPQNYWDRIGKAVNIRVAGRISNIVTTPGTLTLDIRMGPTSNIIAHTTQAIQLNAVAKTNVTFIWELELQCRSVGSGTTATVLGIGNFTSESVVGSGTGAAGSTGNGSINTPASAPAAGTGFDSTVAMTVDCFATFSLTGNSITAHQFKWMDLN